jgi:ferritin
MQRIRKMGDASFQLRDKIAVDELFTFVAEQQERRDDLENHHDRA